ncbi:pantoate-beta-alanine [Cystoisospora suis]|uniref:Pantoate--beta-alanine ligase n=1 Tax=Cystoisospora suis TaxID=483139 RepID=A0A2C6KTI2_9APIC|nr:pantoate-beta-alanine [Cystoisospora suis]
MANDVSCQQARINRTPWTAFSADFLPSSSPFFPFGPSEPQISSAESIDSILVLHSPKELLAYRNARPPVPLRFPSTIETRDKITTGNGCPAAGEADWHNRTRRRRISLVPTMGGLHEGHMHLVRSASRIADEVWVTIFLNSFQFQSPQDFYSYPVSVDDDMKLLSTEPSVRLVFIPSHQSLYPLDSGHTFALGRPSCALGTGPAVSWGNQENKRPEKSGNSCPVPREEKSEDRDATEGKLNDTDRGDKLHIHGATVSGESPPQRLFRTRVDFEDIEEVEGEGRRRPGFFRGIGTIVTKLLTLTRPTYAHFGLKDFQQVACIKRLLCGMGANTVLLAHSTSRDPDGLATATRNRRLNTEERNHMRKGYQLLQRIQRLYADGERRVSKLLDEGWSFAKTENLHLYYMTVDRWEDAEPVLYRHRQGKLKRFSHYGTGDASSGNKRAKTGSGECRSVELTGELDTGDKGEEELILDSPGRFCVTIAVRGNSLTTIVDNTCLSDFSKFGDLLPPPLNRPWETTSSEFKYASFTSFVLLMSLGCHLRRLSKEDLDMILDAEAEEGHVTQSQRGCEVSGTSGGVSAREVSKLPWLCEHASEVVGHSRTWALGLLKRSMDFTRKPSVGKLEERTSLTSLSERLIGYVWGEVQEGEKPVLLLRRVFVKRSRRRQTLGSHLLKAYLALTYKEKLPSLGSALVVRTDPLPVWLAHAASEHGFSLIAGESSDAAPRLGVGKDSCCQMELNLKEWYTRFVE